MSVSAPVDGSSICVSERSIVVLILCWVGRAAVAITSGGAVELAGYRLYCGMVVLWVEDAAIGIVREPHGWNLGVMGLIISGTSVWRG